MKKLFSGLNPVEIIFDIFIVLGIFVALAASFIIIIQALNNNQEVLETSMSLSRLI